MSSVDDAISYIFMWHSLSDACPKCQQLNGREWRDQDLYQGILWDRIWGNLWDLNNDVRLTHPNCRCQLEVRVECDWSKWKPFIELNQTLQNGGYAVSSDVRELRDEVNRLKQELVETKTSMGEVVRLLNASYTLTRQLGGRDLPDVILKGHEAVMVLTRLRLTMLALQTAAGPIGWALAGIGLVTTAITTGEFVGSAFYDSTRGT